MKIYIYIHLYLVFMIYFSETHGANNNSTKNVASVNIVTEEKSESRSVKKELNSAEGLLDSKIPVQNKTSYETPKDTHLTNTTHKSPEVESGTVIRGVLVFVGIGLLFIMYLGCKTYRKKKPSVAIVKKYGVRTNRSDLEMEPLPLDEDDEDETLFDVKNINRT